MPRPRRCALLLLLLCAATVACGSDPAVRASNEETSTSTPDGDGAAPVIDPGDGGDYHPTLDPADFVERIDNPYLPLLPGATWRYEGDGGAGEVVEVTVTDQTRVIGGITAVVVRDTVTVDGVLEEDTFDWFAQDTDGNVWYLGEDSTEYDEAGKPAKDGGSWEHGKDGAVAGIAMPARPAVGDAYRQEYLPGTAEDMAEILELEPQHHIALGTYQDVVVVEEWTPLEPDVVEQKWYAPGVGQIAGEHVKGEQGASELVEFTPGR